MKKLLVLALVTSLLVPSTARSVMAQEDTDPYDCAAQGMWQLESGACAPFINGIPPANGVAYSPEEVQTLNEPLRMCIFTCYPMIRYDPDYGAWYYYYYDTGAWYWA
jgi:hypothetical protein